jgi:hypothetical protein
LQYELKVDLLDEGNLKTFVLDRALAKREELRKAKNDESETIQIQKKGVKTQE